MKILRLLLLLAVVAYAGWLAWPFVSALMDGAGLDAAVASAQAASGLGDLLTPSLWLAAVALYLIAAALLGSGNPRAAVAYFLGFVADAALRLAIERGRADGGAADASARSMDVSVAKGGPEAAPADLGAAMGVDPLWLLLGGLVLLGLLILAATRRRRRVRTPGQLSI